MALETGNRIEDLVISNPAVGDDVSLGDDHLRLIKACVQGSFPSLGSTAVSVTAAQINDVPNKLISFNGRPDVEAFPAAGDYSLDMLSDVDTTTTAPVTNDLLGYTGSSFEPVKGAAGGYAHYYGEAGRVSEQVYFSTAATDGIDGVFGTVTNTGALTGWEFEADTDLIVNVAFSSYGNNVSGSSNNIYVAISLNSGTTSKPAAGASLVADSLGALIESNPGGATATAAVKMASGDKIHVYRESSNVTITSSILTITALACV